MDKEIKIWIKHNWFQFFIAIMLVIFIILVKHEFAKHDARINTLEERWRIENDLQRY